MPRTAGSYFALIHRKGLQEPGDLPDPQLYKGAWEGWMFVLRTGLDVPAVEILHALPLPLVPRDLNSTAFHTNFSLCAELP